MNSNSKSHSEHPADSTRTSDSDDADGRSTQRLTEAAIDDAAQRPSANNEPGGSGAESPSGGLDPFDPARIRVSQDYEASIGVKKILTTVPVRKPSKERFVRTHTDPDYRIETVLLELKEDRELYLVDRNLWPTLEAESTVAPRALFLSVTRQGDLFFWPIRLPGPDGKWDSWNRSALEAATRAAERWVRVQPNMSAGMYDLYEAAAGVPDPEWPDVPMRELIRLAFKDYHITSVDHPVLKRLRGEG